MQKVFKEYEHRYAIQYRAEAAVIDEAPIDHLLLLKLPNETLDQMSAKIEERRKRRFRGATKKVIIGSDGTRSNEEVHCITDSEAITFDGLNQVTIEDYWKKLNILLQAFVRNTSIEKATATKSDGILIPVSSLKSSSRDPGFGRVTETAPVPSTDSAPAVADISSIKSTSHIQDAMKVDRFLRTLVKLDPNRKKLHLELDLVPGVNAKTSLADIVTSVFGRAIQGQSVHHHLPTIRAMLIGLEVNRNYTPPTANGLGDTGEVQSSNLITNAFPQSSPKSGSGASSRKVSRPLGELSLSDVNMKRSSTAMNANTGHAQQNDAARSCRYVVSDIQLAGDVPDFVWKDGKRYSVAKYFRESKRYRPKSSYHANFHDRDKFQDGATRSSTGKSRERLMGASRDARHTRYSGFTYLYSQPRIAQRRSERRQPSDATRELCRLCSKCCQADGFLRAFSKINFPM